MFKTKSQNRVDTVFVLMIFCGFAISVFLVLILGGSTYQNMNDISQEGQSERIVMSYIRTKIRNIDDVTVGQVDNTTTLELKEHLAGRTFVTIIYLYDGWVREHFHELGRDVRLGDGVPIIDVDALDFEAIDSGLIRVSTNHGDMIILPRSGRQGGLLVG